MEATAKQDGLQVDVVQLAREPDAFANHVMSEMEFYAKTENAHPDVRKLASDIQQLVSERSEHE